MATAFGCLVWIVVFAGVLLLEHDGLMRLPAMPRDLPLAWGLAAALSLGVTLTAGSLHGLLLALWRRLRPADTGRWRDGETVRVGGVLEPAGPVLQAPFTGRPAACLTYSAHAQERGLDGSVAQRPHLRGLQQVPCRLRVGSRHIELRGFPSPQPLPEEDVTSPEAEQAAARHLARATWQASPDIGSLDLLSLRNPFAQARPGAGPDAGLHLINAPAQAELELPRLAGREAALLQRLRQRRWHFEERIWPPGQAYTAVGTWRAQPPHLDIGYGPTSADHGLHPGTPQRLASRELVTAGVFTLVLGALTVAAHLAVRHEGGAWLRSLGEAAGIRW
jgi:hypothetical protein